MTLQQNGFRLYVNIDIKTQGEDTYMHTYLLNRPLGAFESQIDKAQ